VSWRAVNCVMQHLGLKGTTQHVAIRLAHHAHRDGSGIWAAQPTIAREAGLHRATVQRHLDKLIADHHLLVEARKGKHTTNRYRLRLCEACAAEVADAPLSAPQRRTKQSPPLSAAQSGTKQGGKAAAKPKGKAAAQSGTKKKPPLSAAQSGGGSRRERRRPPLSAAQTYPEPVPNRTGVQDRSTASGGGSHSPVAASPDGAATGGAPTRVGQQQQQSGPKRAAELVWAEHIGAARVGPGWRLPNDPRLDGYGGHLIPGRNLIRLWERYRDVLPVPGQEHAQERPDTARAQPERH